MQSLLRQLHRTCLPFVTRSLRGNRMRRTLALSVVLAITSLFTGAWLALGAGSFEHDIRRGLDLEPSLWDRARVEHVIFVHHDYELHGIQAEVEQVLRQGDPLPEWGRVTQGIREAVSTLHHATQSNAPRRHAELQSRARELHESHGYTFAEDWYSHFDWNDPNDVARLDSIVEHGLIPRVERYRSPLGVVGAIKLISVLGGGAILFGLFVVGPLTVGTQLAQEAHENTLAPLTGTALSARELVLGLSSGPLVVLGIVLAPQAVLFLVGSAATGSVVPALGTVALALAGSALLVMLTGLAGLALGRRQSPGLVGTALLSALGLMFLLGLALGCQLAPDTLGLVTIVPHAGAFHLLRESLAPAGALGFADLVALDLRLVVAGLVFVVLTGVTLAAVQRRIAASSGPTLRRGEAFVGAAMIVLASLLVPHGSVDFRAPELVGTLALVVVPFMLLVMARVPVGVLVGTGDAGRRAMRGVVLRCLGEFGAFVALHVFAATLLWWDGPWALSRTEGSLHLVWALAVAGLVAIRVVVVPTRLLGALYLGFCLLMALVAYVTGAVFLVDGGGGSAFFALSHLSPMLGAAEALLWIVIPWSLLRAPRRP